MTALAVLILIVPAATVLAAHYSQTSEPAEAAPAVGQAALVTGSSANTVALISVPFLMTGLLIMVGYRRGVIWYQVWRGRKDAALPGSEGV